MQFYQIHETLMPVNPDELSSDYKTVAVINEQELNDIIRIYDLKTDMEIGPSDTLETKAVVNYESLTGSLYIPDRGNICGIKHGFTFALNSRGIILIDNGNYALGIVENVRKTKKWRMPGLERFVYDFLEEIISPDLRILENMEHRLNVAEEEIQNGATQTYSTEINDMRGELLDLRMHYEQLIDFSLELEENENEFFAPENIRYFQMFTARVNRLQERVSSLREYVMQLRDLEQSQMDEKQNRIVTLLTIVATIFMPLTLIAGWYGMNFKYMPELEWRWAYPAVFVLSVAIVVICIYWFRKKNWM